MTFSGNYAFGNHYVKYNETDSRRPRHLFHLHVEPTLECYTCMDECMHIYMYVVGRIGYETRKEIMKGKKEILKGGEEECEELIVI